MWVLVRTSPASGTIAITVKAGCSAKEETKARSYHAADLSKERCCFVFEQTEKQLQ